MSLLIVERKFKLVIDSRLVADSLRIQHKNLLATLEKYEEEAVAEGFSPLAFETRLVKRPQGGSYEERWAWLDEEWANYAMILSRNTPEVRAAKRNLVKAFSKAKLLISDKDAITSQPPQPAQPAIDTNLYRKIVTKVTDEAKESINKINHITSHKHSQIHKVGQEQLETMDEAERRQLFFSMSDLSLQERQIGKWSSRLVNRYLGFAPGQDRTVSNIMRERDFHRVVGYL